MKRYIIIPARYKSSRLPGKVLMDINGMPMVARVWEQAMQVPNAEVIVATNDPDIEDVIKKYGGNTCRTSEQNRNGMERVADAAAMLDIHQTDVVMNLQADMPFIDPQLISDVLNSTPPFGVVTAASLHHNSVDEFMNPNDVKVVVSEKKQVLYFSRTAVPAHSNSAQIRVWHKRIGLYSMSYAVLKSYYYQPYSHLETVERLEQLRFYEMGVPISVLISDEPVISINTQEDYDKVQRPISNITWPDETVGHVI